MSKAAAKKKTTTTSEQSVEGYLDEINAKSLFLSTSINMGWQLAVTVVVPLVAGIKIDQKFGTAPSFSLLGIMIAAAAGSATVWNNVKQANEKLKEPEETNAKSDS